MNILAAEVAARRGADADECERRYVTCCGEGEGARPGVVLLLLPLATHAGVRHEPRR